MKPILDNRRVMKMQHYFYLTCLTLIACQPIDQKSLNNVITTDINNFWEAYEAITEVKDTTQQYELLDSLYLDRGTDGLRAIIQARNYTPQEFLTGINNYPKFWASIKGNTKKADQYVSGLNNGIERLKDIYPDLRPAKIYFTIGAFRTGGTTLDSLVLIGSEISITDSTTVTEEFPDNLSHLPPHFKTNPKKHLVFLNVHEYVHTQQKSIVHNVLSFTLYEGVAEFVASKALGIPSPNPQIEFGKKNAEPIREVFEREVFYHNNMGRWLSGNTANVFRMRDLGYYVGYQMCENYYDQAEDKQAAIKTMIELDYENEPEIEAFVAATNYFSMSLDSLYQNFENNRPTVSAIKQFENNSQNVDHNIKNITVEFSRPLNGRNTGVDFGDLGQDAFPKNTIVGRQWSDDNRSWTIPVTLEPNKRYQILISNNFRTEESVPLKAYLIDFKTRI